MASLILVDFRLFPDNHPLPPQFALGGLDFAAIDPSTPPFVNETAGERGLQFKRTGLRISLPGTLDSVLMTAGGFAGPITVRALDAGGQVLKSQQLQPPNRFVRYLLNAPGMSTVEIVEGGHEGILAEIVVPC